MLAIQLVSLKGNGAPEVVTALTQCLQIPSGKPDNRFDTLWTLQACHLVRGEINAALEIGAQLASEIAAGVPEERRLRACRLQGLAKLLAGDLKEAFNQFERALDIYDPDQHGTLRFRHASDQGAIAHAQFSWGKAIAGQLEASARSAKLALDLGSHLNHPHTTAHVVCVLAARAQTLGDVNATSSLAHAGKTLGEGFEFPYWSAWAEIFLGWVAAMRGSRVGLVRIEKAMAAYQRTGAIQALPYAHLLLAKAAMAVGMPERALQAAGRGLQLARKHGLHLYSAELLIAQAKARLHCGEAGYALWALISEALFLAQTQGAHTFSSHARQLLDDLWADENAKRRSNLSAIPRRLGTALAL